MKQQCIHLKSYFNDTATTEIYTLSLHDTLPISTAVSPAPSSTFVVFTTAPSSNRPSLTSCASPAAFRVRTRGSTYDLSSSRKDRKSTRLNSSHANISYAVFCLK